MSSCFRTILSFYTLLSSSSFSWLPSQLSTQVQQLKLTQPQHIDLYILHIKAPSSLYTALMEFPSTLSLSISIHLHHRPTLSGGVVILKAIRLERWPERQRGSLCTILLMKTSSRGRSTVETHNTTALLLVETTQTGDSGLCAGGPHANECLWLNFITVILGAACRCYCTFMIVVKVSTFF